MGRKDNSQEKNMEYDARYHSKNRDKRNKSCFKCSNSLEQRIWRRLYCNWRSQEGKKPFPSLYGVHLKLAKTLENGCNMCGKVLSFETMTIDHLDHNPKNNSFENLQWLCKKCHVNKTVKHRIYKSKWNKLFKFEGID